MISSALQDFCDRMLAARSIGVRDVRELRDVVLANGPTTREDADTLIALDRAVSLSDTSWADYLVEAVVGYAVWTARPSGIVDGEAARWLVDSLGCGSGPTANGARVAFETVREAHRSDDTLMAFALDANRRTRGEIALPVRAAA